MAKPATDPTGLARRLRAVGLRPTRQRLTLAGLLFGGPDRHVTAEQLRAEAAAAGAPVALATVYNSLHQFAARGLLREVTVEPGRICFDTNLADHHHFYCPRTGQLSDIPEQAVRFARLPDPPPGRRVAGLDLVIRLDPASD